MTKNEFILALRKALGALPADEVNERLEFYSEMIDDRIEEGLSEEEAVLSIGGTDGIAEQILSHQDYGDAPDEKTSHTDTRAEKKRRLAAWEILLIVLGAPLWLSIVVTLIAVIVSLAAVLWSVIISIWAAGVSFVGGAVGGIFSGIVNLFGNNTMSGIALIGAGIILLGLSILTISACSYLTKRGAYLTKKSAIGIATIFRKKEEA